jgi:hypothetical protein
VVGVELDFHAVSLHWFKKQSSTGSKVEALHNLRGILHDSQVQGWNFKMSKINPS